MLVDLNEKSDTYIYTTATVFPHCVSISLPQDSCGWSSLTATGEGELRRTDIRLSVESEGHGS